MLALCLPLLLLALWFLRRPHADSHLALIQALLIWGGLIVGLTEILSLFRALSPLVLVVSWGALTMGAWVLVLRNLAAMRPFTRPSLSRWLWATPHSYVWLLRTLGLLGRKIQAIRIGSAGKMGAATANTPMKAH